jgi:hypothetical protein
VKTSMLELDEATVAAEQNEEHGVIAVIDDGSENIEDIAAMMTELECTFNGCTEGAGGSKFKTPPMGLTENIFIQISSKSLFRGATIIHF